jgi:hypothetical protein
MQLTLQKILVVGGNGFIGLSFLSAAHRVPYERKYLSRLSRLSNCFASWLPGYQYQVSSYIYSDRVRQSVNNLRVPAQLVRTTFPNPKGPHPSMDRKGCALVGYSRSRNFALP